MVKIYKFFSYALFFFVMLIVFLPKENLYFALEKELKKENIIIYNETIEEGLFSLDLDESIINFQKIDIAKVDSINFNIYGLYNSLEATNIRLFTFSKNFLPSKISSLKLQYSVLDPLVITIYSKGDFGVLDGRYDFIKKLLQIKVIPSKKMLKEYKNTLRFLKKSQNGEYIYEQTL